MAIIGIEQEGKKLDCTTTGCYALVVAVMAQAVADLQGGLSGCSALDFVGR